MNRRRLERTSLGIEPIEPGGVWLAMGRQATTLLLFTLGWGGLVGCGENGGGGEAVTLLEVPADASADEPAGPTLAGRARAPAPSDAEAAGNATAGPVARVDELGGVTIPPGATWGTVRVALEESARLRVASEDLHVSGGVLVKLPGVEGHVLVGGVRGRGPAGLDLRLLPPPGGLRVHAVGTAWVAGNGCEAEVDWQAGDWSLGTWSAALARLTELGVVGGEAIRIDAHPSIAAAVVLPFVAAATAAGFDPVRVEIGHHGPLEDAVDTPLRWLPAHQAPTGAWDDEVALGLCEGHRMGDVPLRVNVDAVANAGETGLCVLAFLGAGYTNRGKHDFARVVSRGLRHLKNIQRPDGLFPGAGPWQDATAHACAALAMVEAFGMTGSPIFKGSAQRALDALPTAHGWARDDPLATALTAMTLRSAQLVNADCVRREKPAPLAIDTDLTQAVLDEGLGYATEAGDLRAICGLLVRILLDPQTPPTPELEAAALRIADALEGTGAELDPIEAWLGGLVCRHIGREPWKRAARALQRGVVETQRRDGHPCCFKGSWDPRPNTRLPGGRVTATAACSLSLLLYYRYEKVFASR